MILKAYAVPHPPIILPEVGRGEEKKIQRSIDAMKRMADEIATLAPDTIIISSPHAPMYADGFFLAGGKRAVGTLSQFGIGDVIEEIEYDVELADRLRAINQDVPFASPGRPSESLDHGTLIPLRFINSVYNQFKVLRLGLSGYGAVDHYRLGQMIARAAQDLERRAVYIASGDLSHVLKESGPYGYREEGPAFDKKIVDILSRGA
ncbi:MAG TPA: AmmeMemoRadiSam system protein A, partial [Clostridiaceae bacterium]|nr:AmmeMemoRadiSam system protein A [Clostridiaceae bacterium]